MCNKKVLVTGANGLLGANVSLQLSLGGFVVMALVRKGSNKKALNNIKCEVVECDMMDFTGMDKIVRRCDYVVHCAANTKQNSVKSAYYHTNVNATAMLIQLCRLHKIEKFVFVSTANCFTNGTLENPGDETGGFMPWLKKSGYAYSKFLAQQIVLYEVKENDFPAVVVAPTFIIGPRDAKISSGKLLMHGFNKRVVFYPPGGKSVIDAEFAAKAIVNSLSKGKTGEVYLLSGQNIPYKQLFKLIAHSSSKKTLLVRIPRWILATVAWLCSFIEAVFCVSLPLNITNQRLLCLDNYFSNTKAVRHLGLEQTNTDHAVRKAVYWYKENGYL